MHGTVTNLSSPRWEPTLGNWNVVWPEPGKDVVMWSLDPCRAFEWGTLQMLGYTIVNRLWCIVMTSPASQNQKAWTLLWRYDAFFKQFVHFGSSCGMHDCMSDLVPSCITLEVHLYNFAVVPHWLCTLVLVRFCLRMWPVSKNVLSCNLQTLLKNLGKPKSQKLLFELCFRLWRQIHGSCVIPFTIEKQLVLRLAIGEAMQELDYSVYSVIIKGVCTIYSNCDEVRWTHWALLKLLNAAKLL